MTLPQRTYPAKLVRVVDGDTVDLDVDLGFHLTARLRFRLKDIDTPERGEPGWTEATGFTLEWFRERANLCTVLSFKDADLYSRWLGIVKDPPAFVAGAPSLNERLVSEGHAVVSIVR